MDFFTVPNATFQLLWVFFVLHHGRRRVLHFAVTDHSGAQWIVEQLREAFPFDRAPRYVICDRDGKCGLEVPAALSGLGVKRVRTASQAPWQNGVAERWVGSVRRELLDHVVVFNPLQLHRLLVEYVRYYLEDRCHLTLGKDTPDGRVVSPRPLPDAQVIGLARVAVCSIATSGAKQRERSTIRPI